MSEDNSAVPSDVLRRSRGRDLRLADQAATEQLRLDHLKNAVATQYELARREWLDNRKATP